MKLKSRSRVVLVLPFVIFPLLFLWLEAGIIAQILQQRTLLLESGEFYGDRLLNMSFARTVMEHGFQFLDPFNRREPVVYQFAGWWMLGAASAALGVQPWAAANLIHLVFAPAVYCALSFAGRRLQVRGLYGGLLIVFLFSNLEFFVYGGYNRVFGSHAILLPFLRQIFGFYADSYALLFGLAAFAVWLPLLKRPATGRAVLFLGLACVSFLLHFLPALFFLVLFYLTGVAFAWVSWEGRVRRRALIFFGAFAALYAAALVYYEFRLPMPLLAASGGAAGLFVFVHAQNRLRGLLLLPALAMVPAALLALANILEFRAHSAGGVDYNENVRMIPLSIPASYILKCYFPVIVLSIVSFWKDRSPLRKGIKAAVMAASVLLVFNHAFGYGNHPYRFVPYAFPFWALLAGDGLVRLLAASSWKARLAAGGLGILLAMGSWSSFHLRPAYDIPGNYRPVDPLVLTIRDEIERIRQNERNAVFFSEYLLMPMERLAPHTAARFLTAAPINTASRIGQLLTYDQVLARNARPDYVITERLLALPLVSELQAGDRIVRFYRSPAQ